MAAELRPIPDSWYSDERSATQSIVDLELSPADGESYRNFTERVASVLTRQNPWGMRPWELLIAGQDDRPVNRAVGFWRRHGDSLGVRPGAIEAWTASDNRIRRVAANPIDDLEQFLLVLRDPLRRTFFAAVILPTTDAAIADLVDAALTMPLGANYRMNAGLALAAANTQCCALVGDENADHRPSLSIYGSAVNVSRLVPVLSE